MKVCRCTTTTTSPARTIITPHDKLTLRSLIVFIGSGKLSSHRLSNDRSILKPENKDSLKPNKYRSSNDLLKLSLRLDECVIALTYYLLHLNNRRYLSLIIILLMLINTSR